jgi:hypothetical protein
MHPEVSVSYRPCGTEYRESTGVMSQEVPRCACGLFAIGACVECGGHACGTHGTSATGRFLCSTHARAAEVAAREAAERAEAARLALPPPPRPPAPSLAEMVEVVRAEDSRQQAANSAADYKRRQALKWATEIHAELVEMIRAAIAVPNPHSVRYDVVGERRSMKWGLKGGADPTGIGTRVGETSAFGYSGDYAKATIYEGLWPAMLWVEGWSPYGLVRDSSPEPTIGSIWFNGRGMIIAGTAAENVNGIQPRVTYYASDGVPSMGSPTSAWVRPPVCTVGPLHVETLGPEHVARMLEKALGRPSVVPVATLAKIMRGEEPQTVF